MPELPEVETVRIGLASTILGFKVQTVGISDARSIKKGPHSIPQFISALENKTLKQFVRRGKFIWIPFESEALVIHLGMSGQVLVRTKGFEDDKCTRITFDVANESEQLEVRFVDQRLFGGMYFDKLVSTKDGLPSGYSPETEPTDMIPSSVSHIARDILDENFDIRLAVRKLLQRKTGIKNVLLDQKLMSGIGNIYADEALWQAKLHYSYPANRLTAARARGLIEVAQVILSDALKAGGTSFDEQYKMVNGQSGFFATSLKAYGQTGLPCTRCGTKIRRDPWANRGSHFCPRCQRPPR